MQNELRTLLDTASKYLKEIKLVLRIGPYYREYKSVVTRINSVYAKAEQGNYDEAIAEIESIVHSGTKVNIAYYINDNMDEDKQQEAMEYFKESATDSIEAAISELGEDDYTEEEIRLMRIRFMSEFGN